MTTTQAQEGKAKSRRGISRACLKARRAARSVQHSLRADPYYLGDEAWHYGQPEKANPFTVGTENHEDWKRGWREAEFDAAGRHAQSQGGAQ